MHIGDGIYKTKIRQVIRCFQRGSEFFGTFMRGGGAEIFLIWVGVWKSLSLLKYGVSPGTSMIHNYVRGAWPPGPLTARKGLTFAHVPGVDSAVLS